MSELEKGCQRAHPHDGECAGVEFKVGDIVEAFGVRGEVTCTDRKTFVEVRLDHNVDCFEFYKDGRYEHWHKTPSLKLIRRKKQRVKKTIWVNSYTDNNYCVYESEESAIRAANRVDRAPIQKAAPFVGEVEI